MDWSAKMVMTAEAKAGLIASYRTHEQDTGSPEIQIALLTARIQELTEHLQKNLKDHAARRGLLRMVGRRTGMLKYLTRTDPQRYKAVIARLGLRK